MILRHEAPWHRALAALLCLVLHLCANTPAGLLATAAVAWLDGEHSVQLMGRESGSRIVLAHESSDQLRSPTHSHCATCRVVLLMESPSQAGGPDHILDFREPGVLARHGIAAAPPAPVLDAAPFGFGSCSPLAHFLPVLPARFDAAAPCRAAVLANRAQHPAALPVCLVSTTTTVLVI